MKKPDPQAWLRWLRDDQRSFNPNAHDLLAQVIEELIKDAERYRWLTSGWTKEELDIADKEERPPPDRPQLEVTCAMSGFYFHKEQADRLIDEVMQGESVDILPALKGGDSLSRRSMSRAGEKV